MESMASSHIAITPFSENTTHEEMTKHSYLLIHISLRDIILVVLGLVLMVWICITNGLVVYIVLRIPGMRNPINLFISCLGVADLVVGILMPYQIALIARRQLAFIYHVCMFKYISGYFTLGVSALSCLGKC